MISKTKSSSNEIPLENQREAWNSWNAAARENRISTTSQRQAEVIVAWLEELGRSDLDIIDVNCGTGWLCRSLLRFGRITGTDLADQVIQRAQARVPDARFIAGDLFSLDLAPSSFDVAVTLEVLSHVADQPAFLARIAHMLRDGGWLMLATQNRPVLERWSAVGAPIPGLL